MQHLEHLKRSEGVALLDFEPGGLGAERPGEDESSALGLRGRLAALFLRRRWRTIATSTTGCVLLAAAYCSVAPTLYTARATLLVEGAPPVASQDLGAPALANGKDRIETESRVLQSDAVIEPVVDRLSLLDDPAFKPRRTIQSWALAVLEPLVDRLPLLEEPARSLKRTILSWAFEVIGPKVPQRAIPAQGSPFVPPAIATADVAIEKQRPALSDTDYRYAVVGKLQHQLTVWRVPQTNVIEVAFTGQGRERVAQIVGALIESYLEHRRQLDAHRLQETLQWNERWKAQLLSVAKRADENVQRYRLQLSAVGQETAEEHRRVQLEYQRLTDAANAARENYVAVAQQLAKGSFDIPPRSIDVEVITPPTPPVKKSAPKTSVILLAAALGGGLLGIAVGIVADDLSSARQSASQFEEFTRLSCVAVTPLLSRREASFRQVRRLAASGKFRTRRLLPRYVVGTRGARNDSSAAFTRAVSAIQMSANDKSASRPGRVIALTSAAPGAGSTTLAINLAAVAVDRGNKVLLVDCQFQRPALTWTLAPKNDAGVEQVACGLSLLADAVWTDPRNGLDVLPAGDSRLLKRGLTPSLDMVARVVREARAHYDLIVLDLAAPETAREARAASSISDEIYLVIDQGRAPLAALRQLLQVCSRGRMSPCGFILNKAVV